MSLDKRRGHPGEKVAPGNTLNNDAIVSRAPDIFAELDAMAEQLHGYLVVQVHIDDQDHRRTYFYRSAPAAERAVKRANDRGRRAHVTLVTVVPVGVVVGLGSNGDRRG